MIRVFAIAVLTGVLAWYVRRLDRQDAPADWDGESYCTRQDGRPACHRVLSGTIDDVPGFDLVCCEHAGVS